MSLGKKGKKNIILTLIVVCFVLVCVMIYVKKHSEPQMENRIFENPFAGVNEEIDWQSGNYANEALVCRWPSIWGMLSEPISEVLP